MMRYAADSRILGLLVTTVVMGSLGSPIHAQLLDCGPEDEPCLTRNNEIACSVTPRATQRSCAAWLAEVEAHAFADEPEWRIAAASAYMALADMSSAREAVSKYRGAARSIFQGIIARNPTGRYAAQAYTGLSVVVDSLDEKIEMMRRAMAADPSDSFAAESLARMLASREGGAAFRESAELVERAYDARKDPKKWYLAARAVGLYEAAGESRRADAFRRRVYADSGIARITEKIGSAQLHNAEQANSAMAIACNVDIVELFGAKTCIRGIDSVVAAVRAEHDISRRTGLAEAATAGMVTGINAPRLAEYLPEANERFRSDLEMFIAEGVQSSSVYAAYSGFSTDPAVALSALEKAVRLAPEDGELIHGLGLTYLEQMMWSEAIETFQKAKPLLPDWWPMEITDEHLRSAKASLEESETE